MSGLPVAAAIIAAILAVAWAQVMISRHGAGPVVWRFFSGHALDGQFRTNATWTQPASKTLHPTGYARPWHHRPRLHRAGIRTGTTLLVLLAWLGRSLGLAGLGAANLAGGFRGDSHVSMGWGELRDGG